MVYDGDIALYTPTNLWTSTGVSPPFLFEASKLIQTDPFTRPRSGTPLPPSCLRNPHQASSVRSNSRLIHLPSPVEIKSPRRHCSPKTLSSLLRVSLPILIHRRSRIKSQHRPCIRGNIFHPSRNNELFDFGTGGEFESWNEAR